MAPLTLTILGAGPAAPNPGGVCSGYLVRHDGTAVVMDCGSGTAGRIALHVPVNRLDGVAISHLHPDHYFDLVSLYYLLKFGEPRPTNLSARVPVYLPPAGGAFMRRFGELVSGRSAMFEDLLDMREYTADAPTVIGGLSFEFHAVQHYVPSHAMRVQSPTGAVLTFSSDVGPCPALIEAARGADLFMCEASLLDPSRDEANPGHRGHMTAAEAGEAARSAGAKRLLITHFRSSERHDPVQLAAASHAFGGPVELAREGRTYTVG